MYVSTCILIGIVFQCYGPLGSPGRVVIESSDPVIMDDPIIKELASKYNATPAQVSNLVLWLKRSCLCKKHSFGCG